MLGSRLPVEPIKKLRKMFKSLYDFLVHTICFYTWKYVFPLVMGRVYYYTCIRNLNELIFHSSLEKLKLMDFPAGGKA